MRIMVEVELKHAHLREDSESHSYTQRGAGMKCTIIDR